MSFLALAQQAQKELDGEKSRLVEKEARIDKKSSALLTREASLDSREAEIVVKEKSLQVREEEVSRKELAMKRDYDAQIDLQQAIEERRAAEKALKQAEEKLQESDMKMTDLARREIALSEQKKSYKQEIELEVMRNLSFRR